MVGSGIVGERLAGGNVGVARLADTLATAGALVAPILTFGPISGAHFNPAVTLARALSDTFAGIRLADAPAFIVAQLVGAAAATALFAWLARELPERQWYRVPRPEDKAPGPKAPRS